MIGIGLLTTILLAGCGAATFENFSLIGSAKDVKDSTIGKNIQKIYMTDGKLEDVCSEQANLITAANWKVSDEMRKESTYHTATYTDGQAYLTLMCSQQENNAGIKVTLTLQK